MARAGLVAHDKSQRLPRMRGQDCGIRHQRFENKIPGGRFAVAPDEKRGNHAGAGIAQHPPQGVVAMRNLRS